LRPLPATRRDTLRRRNQTKAGRAEADEQKAQPIESPAHVAVLVAAAGDLGGKPYFVTLLALDAGLRLGEATALDWAHVEWERRALRVCQGGHLRGRAGVSTGGGPGSTSRRRRTRGWRSWSPSWRCCASWAGRAGRWATTAILCRGFSRRGIPHFLPRTLEAELLEESHRHGRAPEGYGIDRCDPTPSARAGRAIALRGPSAWAAGQGTPAPRAAPAPGRARAGRPCRIRSPSE